MADSEKVQTLIKRAFNVTSTYKNTPWYDEEFARYQKILEADEINIQTPPTVPIWEPLPIDNLDLREDFNVNIDDNSFFAENTPFQDLHTVIDIENSFFTKDAQMSPGAYIDTTNSVMLFIRLKLDKIDISGIDPNAIAYTKYSLDTSFNSALDNAFQFNYNMQLDVASGPSSTISVFKPYLYTLEYYSNTNLTMQQVPNNIGNWSFDFKSGIITFSNDPIYDNSGIDLSDGDLYFTFVKYVGARGLEKLIEVREKFDIDTAPPGFDNQIIVDSDNNSVFLYKPGINSGGWTPIGGRFDISGTDIFYTNGNVGIGTLLPSTNLDVSGSVIVSNTLTVHEDLVVDTDTFFVDSSKDMVGIGTTSPSHNLDVNGDANIASNLTVGGDISINQTLDASSVNITNDLTVDGSLNIGSINDVESKLNTVDASVNELEYKTTTISFNGNAATTIVGDLYIDSVDNLDLIRSCADSDEFETIFNVSFSSLKGTFLEITDYSNQSVNSGSNADKIFDSEKSYYTSDYGSTSTFIIKYKIDHYTNDASSAVLYEIGGNQYGLVFGFSDISTLLIYGGLGVLEHGDISKSKLFEYNISGHEYQTNIIGLDISLNENSTECDFNLYFNNVLVATKVAHDLTTTILYGTGMSEFGGTPSEFNNLFADGSSIVDISLAVGSFVGLLTHGQYEDYAFYRNKYYGSATVANHLDVSGSVNVSNSLSLAGDMAVDTNTFFVDSAANMVGVGTSSPSTQLDVSGSVNVSNYLTVHNDVVVDGSLNLGSMTDIEGKIDTLDVSVATLESDVVTLETKTAAISNSGGITSMAGDLAVDTETLFVNSGINRVGVGTSSPSTQLDVSGSVNVSNSLTVHNDVVVDGSLNLGSMIDIEGKIDTLDDSVAILESDVATLETNTAAISNSGGITSMAGNFTLAGNMIVDTDTFFVDSAADMVGVGTSLPSTQLDVSGSVNVSNSLSLAGNMIVDTNTFFVDSAADMVGVGTDNPQQTLDVSGTARISSDLTVGGSSIHTNGIKALDGALSFGPATNSNVALSANAIFTGYDSSKIVLIKSGGNNNFGCEIFGGLKQGANASTSDGDLSGTQFFAINELSGGDSGATPTPTQPWQLRALSMYRSTNTSSDPKVRRTGIKTEFPGSVGIGIIPQYKLDVNGSANIGSDLTVGGVLYLTPSTLASEGDVDDLTKTYMRFDGSSTTGNDWCYLRDIGTSESINLTFDFHDDTDDACMTWRSVKSNIAGGTDEYTKVFQIEHSKSFCTGKFGVGTDNPQQTLHVSGTTRISSDLTVDGRVTINNTTDRASPALDIDGFMVMNGRLDVGTNLTVEGTSVFGDGTGKEGLRINSEGVVISCDTASYGGATGNNGYWGGVLGFGYLNSNYTGDRNKIVSMLHSTDSWTMDFYTGGSIRMNIVNSGVTINNNLNVGSNLTLDGNLTVGGNTSYVKNNEDVKTYFSTGGPSKSIYLYFDSGYNGTVNNKSAIILEGGQGYSRHNMHFCLNNSQSNSANQQATTSHSVLSLLSDGGKVGIGTNNPSYKLHVDGTGSSVTGYFADSNSNRLYGTAPNYTSLTAESMSMKVGSVNHALSIYSTGSIGIGTGAKYLYISDERIKTNIRDISDDEALVAFRKLQPKTYNYKDPIKAGYNSVYGFIAQEVEEVIPTSTIKDTGFIPNIYSICEIDNSTNILTFHFGTSGETIEQFDLSVNDVIQIEDNSKNIIERTIINIIDETSIQVNDEYIPSHTHDTSGVELSYNQVFVYGKKVDDLHRLGKDAIWTVAAAALQEVDRQQQSDKNRIATLETEVSTLETQLSELMARVASLEQSA